RRGRGAECVACESLGRGQDSDEDNWLGPYDQLSIARRCQNTTALAAATLRESTPPAIGIITCSSAARSVAGFSPWPSAPSTKATFRPEPRSTASSVEAPSLRASASTSNPAPCSSSTPSRGQVGSRVQGTWKTVPIDTRIERRYSGSAHCGLTSTASTPSAAAERNMAPTLVWCPTTFRCVETAPDQMQQNKRVLHKHMDRSCR